MARIAGVDIPRDKHVEIALTYIYGIGLSTSRKILERTRINPDTRVRDLTEEEVNRLRELIDREYKVEGDLRREVDMNIKRLIEIGSYRGMRGFRSRRTKNNVWDELRIISGLFALDSVMKKRIISGRRAKQMRIGSLIIGRISVDSRYFDPLHKPFYALNVDSCPFTTGTPFWNIMLLIKLFVRVTLQYTYLHYYRYVY